MRVALLVILLATLAGPGRPGECGAQARIGWTSAEWVGSMRDEDRRLLQLTGSEPLASMLLRPFTNARVADSGLTILLVNPQLRTTYNSDVPYGLNDGPMWSGRGWSGLLEAGVEARWRGITARVAPSAAWSENKSFVLAPLEFEPADASPYADQWWSDRIDRPQRYGEAAYSRVSAGESMIRLDWRGVSVGAGTSSLWWGPGIDNTLLLSNNAGGFPHAFIGTSRPLGVYVGRLEAVYIAGRLHDSDFWRTVPHPQRNRRWINGVAGVFAPRGAPGLYLGMSRLFYQYLPRGGLGISDFLNVLDPFQKRKLETPDNPTANDSTDQMFSVFGRWAFPESGFEVYGEWGRNDHAADIRDLLLEPDHASAFLLGFRKVFARDRGFLAVRGELTALAEGRTAQVRPAPPWYAHHIVRQGYTHRGQVLGAAIGPGSDMQKLAADWHASTWSAGAFVERLRNDSDGFYRFYAAQGLTPSNHLRHDVTLAGGVRGDATLDRARLQLRLLHGHQRNRYTQLGNDVHNVHLELRAELRP